MPGKNGRKASPLHDKNGKNLIKQKARKAREAAPEAAVSPKQDSVVKLPNVDKGSRVRGNEKHRKKRCRWRDCQALRALNASTCLPPINTRSTQLKNDSLRVR
jgi:hypothetical protein